MKMLFTLVCLLGLIACGQETTPGEEVPQEVCFTDNNGQEICSSDFKEAWYEAFYADCINMCDLCTTWANSCGITLYTKKLCINVMWDNGTRNADCVWYITEYVNKWINASDCASGVSGLDGDRCRLKDTGFSL